MMNLRHILAACLLLAWAALPCAAAEKQQASPFKNFQDNILDTGISRDEITPIHRPQFVSTADASLSLNREEMVFAARIGDEVHVYPRQIMVWHEIVNEQVGEDRYAVTYCPLTGSLVGYKGKVGLFNTPLGHSGRLLNANTVLFDYSTNSLWPQIMGTAIDGPLEGKELETFPVVWTTWGRAVKRWPEARVLSRPTWSRRPFGKDPYGAYSADNSYYQNGYIPYQLMNHDNRLHPKEPVLGVKVEGIRLAVPKKRIKEMGAANVDFGMIPLLAVYDRDLDTVRMYRRQVGNLPLEFMYQDGRLLDRQSLSEWNTDGTAVYGRYRDTRLEPVPAMDVMWFAWAAFYPHTAVFK